MCGRAWKNAYRISGAGNRTAASGVAWSGCASLRGPLCAGEALSKRLDGAAAHTGEPRSTLRELSSAQPIGSRGLGGGSGTL